MLTDKELVKNCLEELCQKAGVGDMQNMVQRDFEFLCEGIESSTGVLISLSTIKRLFNGQFSRLPQIATLDAVCSFIGYKNWQDFRMSKRQSTGSNPSSGKIIEKTFAPGTNKVNKKNRVRYLVLGGLLFLSAVVLLAWLKSKKNPAM